LGGLFALPLATVVHELGHYFSACLTKVSVHYIQIGQGKLLRSFKALGTTWHFHVPLADGIMVYYLNSHRFSKIKMIMISIAGPLASALLFTLSLFLIICISPKTSPDTLPHHLIFCFLIGWNATCLLYLLSPLVPFKTFSFGRIVNSDMLSIIGTIILTKDRINKFVDSNIDYLRTREMAPYFDPTLTTLESALERSSQEPNNLMAKATAAAYLRQHRDIRALKYFSDCLGFDLPAAERAKMLDQYLSCALDLNLVNLDREHMLNLSGELLELDPHNTSVLGTRAAVLVDTGNIEEGRELLVDVLNRCENAFDRCYSHIFLALAEWRLGNSEMAKQHALQAKECKHDLPALSRLSELAESSGS